MAALPTITPEAASVASPFASSFRFLTDLGLHVLPLIPGRKATNEHDWTRLCRQAPTEAELVGFARQPRANIGAAMGSPVGDGTFVIAIDIDVSDEVEVERIRSAIPHTPMARFGSKGVALFFRAPENIRSTRYRRVIGERDDGKPIWETIVEVLGDGKQVALPPSRHPSGRDYIWLGEQKHVRDLPLFDDDARDQLEEVAEVLGWRRDADVARRREAAADALPRAANDEVGASVYADHCRYINDVAFARPETWVHTLRLFNEKPTAGGVVAVATWRNSGTGRPAEQRERNLSVHRRGIIDFGTGDTYTPLTLVMAAKGYRLKQAVDFLWEKTGLKAEQDAWFESVKPALDRLRARCTNEDRQRAQKEARVLLRQPTPELIIERHGEPSLRAHVPWLIKDRLYEKGVALFGGSSQGAKTFAAIHMAVGVATGTPVFSEPTRKRAGTLFVVGEAGGSMHRRLDAASYAITGPVMEGVNLDSLPISFIEMTIDGDAKRAALITAAKKEAERMRERHDVDLGIVVFDTLAACCGFKDENDAADAQRVMNGLLAISRELDCLVIATAHYGKSHETGVRGSSALTASADTIWAFEYDKVGAILSNRRMTVTKVRDAEVGAQVPFALKSVRVGEDEDGDPLFSAYIELTNDPLIVHVRREARLSQGALAYLAAFGVVFSEAQDARPFGADGPVVRAVDREIVRREFYAAYPADGDTPAKQAEAKRKAFNNGERSLVSRSKIVTRLLGEATLVWKQQ